MRGITSGFITPTPKSFSENIVLSIRQLASATERNALISVERPKIIRLIIFNSQRRRSVFQRLERVSTGAAGMLNPAQEVLLQCRCFGTHDARKTNESPHLLSPELRGQIMIHLTPGFIPSETCE